MLEIAVIGLETKQINQLQLRPYVKREVRFTYFQFFYDYIQSYIVKDRFHGLIHLLDHNQYLSDEVLSIRDGLRIFLPVSIELLHKKIIDYVSEVVNKRTQTLSVNVRYERVEFKISKVYQAYSNGRHTFITFKDNHLIKTRFSLYDLTKETNQLVRVNHSCVVAFDCILRYSKQQIWLVNGECEVIGRTYQKRVMERMGNVYVS